MLSLVFVSNNVLLTLVGLSVPASVDTTLTRQGRSSCPLLFIDCDVLMSRLELGELPACLDQDECAEDNGGCEQDCVNTVGSHRYLSEEMCRRKINNPLKMKSFCNTFKMCLNFTGVSPLITRITI